MIKTLTIAFLTWMAFAGFSQARDEISGPVSAEIIRVIDAMQLSDEYNVATPVDWKDGDDVIIPPSVKNEDIAANYPKGYTEIKPYLRTTPAPNK